MSGSFDDQGRLEIADGRIIVAVGKKRSGKSIMGKYLFRSYPGDRLIIDVAGDDGPVGPAVHEIVGRTVDDLPTMWPEHLRDFTDKGRPKQMTLRYAPDAGSPTVAQEIDHVIGLGLIQGGKAANEGRTGVCILVHEIGVVAPVHRTQPWMRRLLAHNRHNSATLIGCGPRPQTVDPLVLQQADLIYTFEMMNPNDRKRVAETIGWSPVDFTDAVNRLGPHEYLRYDANELQPDHGEADTRLLHFPALPEEVVRQAQAAL